MKAASSLAICLAALTPLTAAWPKWLPDVDSLVVRQDEESSREPSASPTASPSPSESSSNNEDEDEEEEEPSGTASASGRRQTDLNTAEVPSGSESASRTQTEFDPNDPVGGVVMLTPAPTDPGLKLYKVGDIITFGWNYTNLQAPPTAIDVLVSCAAASATWTLTQNMTWESEGAFTWESEEQATAVQSPLLTEEYTLIIHDADSDVTATPEPGFLGVFDQWTFDMYTPRPYKPYNEWQCPTCNAAPPGLDTQAAAFALTMSVVTVLSFTWFVTGIAI